MQNLSAQLQSRLAARAFAITVATTKWAAAKYIAKERLNLYKALNWGSVVDTYQDARIKKQLVRALTADQVLDKALLKQSYAVERYWYE